MLEILDCSLRRDYAEAVESPPRLNTPPTRDNYLETLVNLLLIASIYLSDEGPGFTQEQLVEKMREIAGSEFKIEESDINIVLETSTFLSRKGDDPVSKESVWLSP